jgi:molybdopterin-containing oxidoreductase family iron-sulfur binding subunit
MNMNRREFTRGAALVGVGVAATTGLAIKDRLPKQPTDPTGPSTVRKIEPLSSVPESPNEDPLIRMERELKKAMAKPVEERKWVMIIDQRKCVGCHACTVGCIAENHLPPGVVYRPVIAEESGEFPNVRIKFTPRPCMQCEQPPCVPVCPVSATWRRPDGVTIVDYDKCIGCRYCLTACPYGARTSDFGKFYTRGEAEGAPKGEDRPVEGADPVMAWEEQPNHELGKSWNRANHKSPMGNARKCTFCLHRLEVGQLPICSTTCIGRANYFGDANDPDSLVSELLAKEPTYTLLPHKGTKPRVFYIA